MCRVSWVTGKRSFSDDRRLLLPPLGGAGAAYSGEEVTESSKGFKGVPIVNLQCKQSPRDILRLVNSTLRETYVAVVAPELAIERVIESIGEARCHPRHLGCRSSRRQSVGPIDDPSSSQMGRIRRFFPLNDDQVRFSPNRALIFSILAITAG